jgi:outer membrane lipoprotein-sorting protein
MEYGNKADGKPFLSKMVVVDGGNTITLAFSDVKLGNFPANLFTRENLGGPKNTGPKR